MSRRRCDKRSLGERLPHSYRSSRGGVEPTRGPFTIRALRGRKMPKSRHLTSVVEARSLSRTQVILELFASFYLCPESNVNGERVTALRRSPVGSTSLARANGSAYDMMWRRPERPQDASPRPKQSGVNFLSPLEQTPPIRTWTGQLSSSPAKLRSHDPSPPDTLERGQVGLTNFHLELMSSVAIGGCIFRRRASRE